MSFSTLAITDPSPITIDFRADRRYSLSWGIIDATELALPNAGQTIFVTAGQSIMQLDINGSLLNDAVGSDGSAEHQLWDDLLVLARSSMGIKDSDGKYIKATLHLETFNGTIDAVGWMRNFLADANAPESQKEVEITFNFLFEDDPTTSLT